MKEAYIINELSWRMLEVSDSRIEFKYCNEESGCYEICDSSEADSNILEMFDKKYSIDGNTLVIVTDGKIFASPYMAEVEKYLKKEGFTEGCFSIYMNCRVNQWLKMYDNLLYRRRYLQKKSIIADIKEYCRIKHISEIDSELLEHCLRIPDFGIRTAEADTSYIGYRSEHAMITRVEGTEDVRVYPMESYWGNSDKEKNYNLFRTNVGLYGFRNGIAVFAYSDGNTYVTPDYEVVMALEAAGYEERGTLYVPFAKSEEIFDESILQSWKELCMKYAPERSYDYERDYSSIGGVYPHSSRAFLRIN